MNLGINLTLLVLDHLSMRLNSICSETAGVAGALDPKPKRTSFATALHRVDDNNNINSIRILIRIGRLIIPTIVT